MNLKSKLNLRFKIGLLPVTSLIGILLLLNYTLMLNFENESRFTEIEQQDYPLFEIVTSNWLLLIEVEDLMTESVLSSDLEILKDAHHKAKTLSNKINSIKIIAPQHSGISDKMSATFSAYFKLVSSMSKTMIDSDLSIENIEQQTVIEMHNYHMHFKNLQLEFKESLRYSFSKELEKSRDKIKDFSSFSIFFSVSFILLLAVISLYVIKGITQPLQRLTKESNKIGEGNWDTDQDFQKSSCNDELGLLVDSCSRMKRKFLSTYSELKQARDEAFTTEKLKAEFLATMSHEIRTPMNGILGMAELLQNTNLDKTQNDYIATILNSGNLLLTIINDILDYSKLEAGKVDLEHISFNLEYLICDIEEILGLTIKNKIQLILDYPPDIPHVFIGDPSRIRQIIFNLIGNAIKFTEKGYIRISVRCDEEDEEADGETLINISVEDTGIGMTALQQNNLFQAFSQAHSSTARNYGGTGLGLDICQKLVKLMGGKIQARSEYGKGSCFYFSIALKKESGTSAVNKASLESVKILMVDDNEINRNLFKKLLQFTGATLTILKDAKSVIPELQEAVDNKSPYQLMVLDFNMPSQNGLELGKKILSLEEFRYLRLVMMTSSGQQGDTRLFSDAGFSAYLSKPVCGDILIAVLEAVHGLSYKTSQIITKHTVAEDQQQSNVYQMFNASILLVEDTEINRIVAKLMLTNLGVDIDVARDGLEAIEMWKSNSYDLIFMDCCMPILNGYEATIKIREAEDSTRIPIIALSANVLQSEQNECKQVGMDDFVAKPMSQRDLEKILLNWLPVSAVTKGYHKTNAMQSHTKSLSSVSSECEILDRKIFEELGAIFGEKFTETVFKHAESALNHVNKINEFVELKDVASLEREAHSLKGSSAQFGAIRLSILAYEIEALAGNKRNLKDISSKLIALRETQIETADIMKQSIN